MQVFNYYKTVNQTTSGYQPFMYFDNGTIKKEYRGCFICDGGASQYLVYDGVIVKECVKVDKESIDLFLDVENTTQLDYGKFYHSNVRPWEAYAKAKILLNQYVERKA